MADKVKYLLSLQAIRDRAKIVGEAAAKGELTHFDVHDQKLEDVADYVVGVIKRDYGPNNYDSIPPHGRWQHFDVGNVPRVTDLIENWNLTDTSDEKEHARRLVDLFFVSVLLDAGAGDHWRYTEPHREGEYERSEGIAVASLYMFVKGAFAAEGKKSLVDGRGLEALTAEALAEGFQISESNPILGVDSRATLLRSLGTSLRSHPDIFGEEGRPGNLVDYMLKSAEDPKKLDILTLWDVLQAVLIPAWPKDRTNVNGHPIGDAWPLSVLRKHSSPSKDPTEAIQPFHKLTQWLTYSLTVPFIRILNVAWINTSSLTALPEYRNGGLFVDLGALILKQSSLERGLKASGSDLPLFDAGDDVVVEWRAMTLVLIDKLYEMVRAKMGGVEISMAQLLEAGTWKAGREVAKSKRPQTKSSPILIRSDGTLF